MQVSVTSVRCVLGFVEVAVAAVGPSVRRHSTVRGSGVDLHFGGGGGGGGGPHPSADGRLDIYFKFWEKQRDTHAGCGHLEAPVPVPHRE